MKVRTSPIFKLKSCTFDYSSLRSVFVSLDCHHNILIVRRWTKTTQTHTSETGYWHRKWPAPFRRSDAVRVYEWERIWLGLGFYGAGLADSAPFRSSSDSERREMFLMILLDSSFKNKEESQDMVSHKKLRTCTPDLVLSYRKNILLKCDWEYSTVKMRGDF